MPARVRRADRRAGGGQGESGSAAQDGGAQMIVLVLLWAVLNATVLLAGLIVMAGMVCSLLSAGTWHQRPWFWRTAVAVWILTAIIDVSTRHWIHATFAGA